MSFTDEILQPDQVQSLIEALRRLATCAGKPPDDKVSIVEDQGWTFNGAVYTKVTYPFGFEANLSAQSLKAVLGHLNAPKMKLTEKFVTIKEGGKTFRLSRMPSPAMQPRSDPPDEWTAFHGSWMRRLVPVLPNRTGYRAFSGVYAEPRGYVGAGESAMGHIDTPGPNTPMIVSKELLDMLPSAELEIGTDGDFIWVRSDNSLWCSPGLEGEYPPWDKVIPATDREVVIERAHFMDCLRAVTITSRDSIFSLRYGEESKLTTSKVSYGEARAEHVSDAEAILTLLGGDGERILQTNQAATMLSALDKLNCKTVKLCADETRGSIVMKTVDATPPTLYLFMAIKGVDEIDYESALD